MPREIGDADKQRGKRLKSIREARGLTQYEFADLLNKAAAELHLPTTYRYYTVSRNEGGSISFEDAAVWLSLDTSRKMNEPLRWDWFVFGERKIGKLKPRPGEAIAANGTDRRRSG